MLNLERTLKPPVGTHVHHKLISLPRCYWTQFYMIQNIGDTWGCLVVFLLWLLEFCVLGWICNLNAYKVVVMYTFCVPNHVVRSGMDRVRLEDLWRSRLPGSNLTLGEEFGLSMWLTNMVRLCGMLFWCGGEVYGCLVIFCCGCLNFVCVWGESCSPNA